MRDVVKRICDIIVAIAGIVLAAPLFLLAAILTLASVGRPVIFRQKRPGLHEIPFVMYKFRTMIEAYDVGGDILPDHQRLTLVGCFLRKTSLDELPGLINVLKGDMSLVGPRPLLMEYLPHYAAEHRRRHSVKPGITGWAQVNGRQSIPFSKRMEYDLWYVDNRGLALDIKILFLTAKNVIKTSDVIAGQNIGDVDDLGLSAEPSVARNAVDIKTG
ncbi:MAG: sugar transferase [Actinomycetota bacterium]|nr:sugar transferase [Actinomycetota bacterium]